MSHQTAQNRSPAMESCIRDCTECARICAETVDHCLRLGGKHAEAAHIKRLLDCAQSCQLSVELMSRGSDMAARMCALCAEFCQLCAVDCERMADGDEVMKRCAETCRRCATSCRAMSA